MFLIIILYSIAYANRDYRSYWHHEEIVNEIVTPLKLPHFKAVSLFIAFSLQSYAFEINEYFLTLNGISYMFIIPIHWCVTVISKCVFSI